MEIPLAIFSARQIELAHQSGFSPWLIEPEISTSRWLFQPGIGEQLIDAQIVIHHQEQSLHSRVLVTQILRS
jgi:hypothetical protein